MGPQQGYPQQADPYARPSYSGLGQWAPRGAPAADGSYQPPTFYIRALYQSIKDVQTLCSAIAYGSRVLQTTYNRK